MKYRIVVYWTKEENKYEAETVSECFCANAESVFMFWYALKKEANLKHVEVYNLCGELQDLTKGIKSLVSHAI